MKLTQRVEHGRLVDGVFVVEYTDQYVVDSANRTRIRRRERQRGTWEDGWLTFPSHPSEPELVEYVTRIRWDPVGKQ